MADISLWMAMGCSALAAALWWWKRPLVRRFEPVRTEGVPPQFARLSAEIGGDLLIVGLVAFMIRSAVVPQITLSFDLDWVGKFLVGRGLLLALGIALLAISFRLGRRRLLRHESAKGVEAESPIGTDDLGITCSPRHTRRDAMLVGAWAYLAVLIPIIGLHILQKHLAANQEEPAVQESMGRFLGLFEDGAWSQLSLVALGLVLVVPFFEEVLYRGFFQTGMRGLSAQMTVPPATGRRLSIIFSSVVFTMVHEPFTWIPLFGIAVFLGWLYDRTRCLWTTVTFHALHNALTLAYALLIAAD